MPCPGGHKLKPFTTNHGRFRCNVCRDSFPKGSQVTSCRECDYDLCGGCRAGEWFEVQLQLLEGEPLGVELRKLTADWPKLLRVDAIESDGAAMRRNNAVKPDAERNLRVGDLIYRVNQMRGDTSQMLDACSGSVADISLSVFRSPGLQR